jgi:hypothetical protein
MWRPRLVVRRGKGGGISSPTSTAGYVLGGSIGGALSAAAVAAAISSKHPLFLIGLFSLIFIRDAWAWLAATPEERQAFRAEVERLGGGPDQSRYGRSGAGAPSLRSPR